MRRLLPRERSLWSFAELWADEHQFIAVHSRRAQEFYQRFRFEDVQAIAVTELPHWTIWQMLWVVGGLMVLAAPWRWWALGGPWGQALLACFTVWPLVFAIRELARGPRCRVVFHTAGGAQTIRAVARLPRLPEFLGVVTPLIEQAQGRLESLEVPASATADPVERVARLDRELTDIRIATHAVLLLGAFVRGATAMWPKQMAGVFGLSIMVGVGEWIMAAALWRATSPLLRSTPAGFVTLAMLACLFLETGIALAVMWARFPAGGDLKQPVMTVFEVTWRCAVAIAGLWLASRRWRRGEAE